MMHTENVTEIEENVNETEQREEAEEATAKVASLIVEQYLKAPFTFAHREHKVYFPMEPPIFYTKEMAKGKWARWTPGQYCILSEKKKICVVGSCLKTLTEFYMMRKEYRQELEEGWDESKMYKWHEAYEYARKSISDAWLESRDRIASYLQYNPLPENTIQDHSHLLS